MNADKRTQIDEVFAMQMARHRELGSRSLSQRKRDLRKLKDAVLSHRDAIAEAVAHDLDKPRFESEMSEVYPIVSEIRHCLTHLEKWASPKKVSTPLSRFGTKAWMRPEPKGVTLIVGPWNFPVNLVLSPLISALAAGNTAIIKPSESTPASSAVISSIVSSCFSADHVTVIEGDAPVSAYLCSLPFHHIFFTGGPEIGKKVMAAAATNLTSVTLELGGKSPAIIDKSIQLANAIPRIVHGKFMNSGQVCVAIDYLLVESSIHSRVVEALRAAIGKAYPSHLKDPSLSSIINLQQFDRLKFLLEDAVSKGAVVEVGGMHDRESLRFAPTVLSGVREDMELMKQEIFGPILPLLRWQNKEEVQEILRAHDRPLAFYVFSKDSTFTKALFRDSRAGSTAWNEVWVQYGLPGLPFGGINGSGIGKGHGEFGFNEFSNMRSYVKQRFKWNAPTLVQPPYGKIAHRIIDLLIKRF